MTNETVRIFDYMHISSGSLLSDSNFHLHRLMINTLIKRYPYYHFYLTYPKGPENADIMERAFRDVREFVTFLPISYNGTGAGSRQQVDLRGLYDHILNPDIDINGIQKQYSKDFCPDLIFSNCIETTMTLCQFFYSVGFHALPITYTHWLPQTVSAPYKGSFSRKHTGLITEMMYLTNYLFSYSNACNSRFGKNLLMDAMRSVGISENVNAELEETIQPLYLGNPIEEIEAGKTDEKFPDFTFTFNYRMSQYTGVTTFKKAINIVARKYPELKFKVFFTNVGDTYMLAKDHDIPERYILQTKHLPWKEYINTMYKSDCVIGGHIGVSQWALSTIDAVAAGNIPIFRRKVSFFEEMFEGVPQEQSCNDNLSFDKEDDLAEKIYDVVTNANYYREKAKPYVNYCKEHYKWENRIDDWHKFFQDAYNRKKEYANSPLLEKASMVLNKALEIQPSMTYRELRHIINMGDQRSLSTYKQMLLKQNPEIVDSPQSDKVVFRKKDDPLVQKSLSSWL